MIEKALVTLLEGITENVYPNALPQDPPTPCMVYQLIGYKNERAHDGPTGLLTANFRVALFDESYTTLKETCIELEDLDGYKGTVGDTVIDALLIDTSVDGYEPGVEIPLFRNTYDITILARDADYES